MPSLASALRIPAACQGQRPTWALASHSLRTAVCRADVSWVHFCRQDARHQAVHIASTPPECGRSQCFARPSAPAARDTRPAESALTGVVRCDRGRLGLRRDARTPAARDGCSPVSIRANESDMREARTRVCSALTAALDGGRCRALERGFHPHRRLWLWVPLVSIRTGILHAAFCRTSVIIDAPSFDTPTAADRLSTDDCIVKLFVRAAGA